MLWFWIVLILAVSVVTANALVLLRTARTPRRPAGIASRPDRDDADD